LTVISSVKTSKISSKEFEAKMYNKFKEFEEKKKAKIEHEIEKVN